MTLVRYVEIENFKTFQEKVHIDLKHPAVLIGPNNAGKTSVIQALSLWSRGIRAWFAKKGDSTKEGRERISSGINRLSLLDVPVAETRFLWNATKVRSGTAPVEIRITLGLEQAGITEDCRLIFTYRDAEVIYCKPCPETLAKNGLLKRAAQVQVHLLYPISGIMAGVSQDSEETLLHEGRINVYLGQGQTAQVLRNICYKVLEHDGAQGTQDWQRISQLIERMFLVKLKPPVFNETRGSLVLRYSQSGTDELDIALAGRGLQQTLLILAYLYWRKRSVLLIDEPDAHLEILRQRQIFAVLRHVAQENGCQVVIATHSEVILDNAIDTNLTLLLYGQAQDLAEKKDMKQALCAIGIEHYYKARVHPRVLYVEGSTDVEMLRALALHLPHPQALAIFEGTLNCTYTRAVEPTSSLEGRLDRAAGAFTDYRQHFHTIKKFVPELKGFALFDSDNQPKQDQAGEALAICHWQAYELENYFITRDSLLNFAQAQLGEAREAIALFEEVVDSCIQEQVFKGDAEQMAEFKHASPGLQATLLRNVKMSGMAEAVFRRFAERQGQPILLTKGQFYNIVPHMAVDRIAPEVHEKLDLMVRYLAFERVHP